MSTDVGQGNEVVCLPCESWADFVAASRSRGYDGGEEGRYLVEDESKDLRWELVDSATCVQRLLHETCCEMQLPKKGGELRCVYLRKDKIHQPEAASHLITAARYIRRQIQEEVSKGRTS